MGKNSQKCRPPQSGGAARKLKYAVLAIGALLLINTVILLFGANFTFGMVLQGIASAAIILYAVYLNRIPLAGHIITGTMCTIALVFAIFLAVYGKLDNAEYNEDAVIVLGTAIRGEQVSRSLAKRLDKAFEYYGKNPGALITVCGGQGFQEDIAEALAMERYLVAKGVPPEHIIKEDKSTSTYENLSFARDALKPHFPQGFSCVIVTSNFHIYRASRLARYAGIPANHIGAPTVWYTIPVNYLREMLAVAKMWAMPPKAQGA
ncbi:MAG: YdcF family protein [Chitinispirillia bacterium]|nr:YdcF family protein [Chitinispirillia bacterium]MCL2241999.1 YdcF family protein [Chitinispirillia bacterium]